MAIDSRCASRARWRKWMVACALTFGLSSGLVFGHTRLLSSSPAEAEVVSALDEIALKFSMPVQLDYSQFRLYRMTAEVDEPGTLARQALQDQETGEELESIAIAVAGENRTARTIALQLTEPLGSGNYVLAWRVLAIDTHSTQGHVAFTIDKAD